MQKDDQTPENTQTKAERSKIHTLNFVFLIHLEKGMYWYEAILRQASLDYKAIYGPKPQAFFSNIITS